jgi:hypothetical protein
MYESMKPTCSQLLTLICKQRCDTLLNPPADIPKQLQPCAQVNHKLVFKITFQVKTNFPVGKYNDEIPSIAIAVESALALLRRSLRNLVGLFGTFTTVT